MRKVFQPVRVSVLLFVPLCFLLVSQVYAIPNATADVSATADNAYSLGYGPATGALAGPSSLTPAVENTLNADIFSCGSGPELQAVTVNPGDTHLYIVAWSDNSNTSGVLARVFNSAGNVFYSGSGWEVYATGSDLNLGGTPPTPAQVQAQVALANSGTGPAGSSVGWVTETSVSGVGRLVVGEANDVDGSVLNCPTPGNVFGIVCQTGPNAIGPAARWMWYNPSPGTIPSPFCANGTARGEYLIFRAPAGGPPTVPALSTWGVAALALLLMAGGAWFLRKRA